VVGISGQVVDGEPAHIRRLLTHRQDGVAVGHSHELHVEMMRRSKRAAPDLVTREKHRHSVHAKSADAGLLASLSARCCDQSCVVGLAVAAGLQPAAELCVQRQRHLALIVGEHQGTGREVVGMTAPARRVLAGREVFEEQRSQSLLLGVWRLPVEQHAP